MIRYLLPALLAVMLSIQTGCQPPGGNLGKNTSSSKKQTSQRSTKRSSRPRKRLRLSPDPPKKSIYIPPGISGSNTIILPEVETVMDMIEELSKEAPTMVVWMLDQSASSEAAPAKTHRRSCVDATARARHVPSEGLRAG